MGGALGYFPLPTRREDTAFVFSGGTAWRVQLMVEKVSKIWMDGNLIPWEEANVHILTHSLHYGLAVFEGSDVIFVMMGSRQSSG